MSTKRNIPKWNDQYPSCGHQPPSALLNQVLLSERKKSVKNLNILIGKSLAIHSFDLANISLSII